jgi:hypothetical protein
MQFGATATDVPSKVQESFKSKYPTATDVEWYDEDGTYEAYFYVNEQSKTAKFNAAGSWTETKTFMDESQIPASVTKVMKASYADATISGATLVELPNALNQYEVSIESDNTTIMLTYNEKGELLKKLEEVMDTEDAIDADDEDASDDDDE